MAEVRELADRLEIQELLSRYCFAVDRADWDLLATVYTDDAVMAGFDPVVEGRDAIVDTLEQSFSLEMFPRRQHAISASMIILDGDRASGETYFVAPCGHDDGGGVFWQIGTYHDRFVRTPDMWRIARREVEVTFTDGSPPAALAAAVEQPD